ncbi:MAG TPA: RNA polymerase sigma factor, partial [Planctomycetota bacterium]|nr:RNA polymerase sigma factor [Planctomycetota bacterium]
MTPTGPSLEVLLANAGWMRRLARRLARDEGEAEDLVQETWLAALRRGPGEEPPASWLAQVLRNLASKAERSRRHRRSREALAARPEKLASTAELYERARLQRELASAVLELGEPYASTILLRYFEGLPPRAIARRQGVSISTVKTRLARGQERLRERLEREHGGREAWLAALVPLLYPASAPDATLGKLLVNAKLKLAVAMAVALAVAMISLLAVRLPWRRISELAVSATGSLSDAAPTRRTVADPPLSGSPYGPLLPGRLFSQATTRGHPMTLSDTPLNRTLATRSLWWTSVAMVLSLAALPAAAQNQLWIDQLGTSSSDGAHAAAPDGSDGMYVGGNTGGSLGGPNAGYSDAWLARYDSAGSQLWIRQLGTSLQDGVHAAAPDGSGGAYVSGWTYGSLGGPNAGHQDAWLARYDSA